MWFSPTNLLSTNVHELSGLLVDYKMEGREKRKKTLTIITKGSDYETMKSGMKGEKVSIFHSSLGKVFFLLCRVRSRLDRAFVSFQSRKIN